MAAPEVKYKGLAFKRENKKYNVKVSIRQGEEDKVSAKHEGKRAIAGGYFADPLIGAQLVDK